MERVKGDIDMKPIIDAHIHLDMYKEREQNQIIQQIKKGELRGLVTVSFHLSSAKENYRLAKTYKGIYPAFGFHPEQPLPSEKEVAELLQWMEKEKEEMIAIGEVGLPYYSRLKNKDGVNDEAYIELLKIFIELAGKWDLPIILHAVYEDAPIACELLEQYSIKKAHFHWFKGDKLTTERLIRNGYMISLTPDILYKDEIQQLAIHYPIEQMMVETDGPWPFEGPFTGKTTDPQMIHHSIKKIAELKKEDVKTIYQQLYENTCTFYGID